MVTAENHKSLGKEHTRQEKFVETLKRRDAGNTFATGASSITLRIHHCTCSSPTNANSHHRRGTVKVVRNHVGPQKVQRTI